MNNSFLVAIREKEGDNKIFNLLIGGTDLANLLLNLDDKYEIGDIITTYAERSDSILGFCKTNEGLTVGEGE